MIHVFHKCSLRADGIRTRVLMCAQDGNIVRIVCSISGQISGQTGPEIGIVLRHAHNLQQGSRHRECGNKIIQIGQLIGWQWPHTRIGQSQEIRPRQTGQSGSMR